MTEGIIIWGSIILIGIAIIMSGYSKASDDERETKIAKVKAFIIVVIVCFLCGWLGLCDNGESHYDDDPSMWIHNARP